MNVRLWLDTAQAGKHTGHHPDTIARALRSGELHGSQRKKSGRWRIHVECLNAWCGGQPCAHQINDSKAGAA